MLNQAVALQDLQLRMLTLLDSAVNLHLVMTPITIKIIVKTLELSLTVNAIS